TETAATGVLANDTDAEGAITAILVTGPTNESAFTLNADGSFTYTHDGSETTSDSFTYKANDGTADSNTVTVTITVNAVNDAPVAVADAYSVNEGGTLSETAATGVLANDTDADGSITAVLVSGPTNESAFTLNADGSFTYTHDGSETTSDSFTYKANDGTADSNTVTVTITVNAVNDAPVAAADAYSVDEAGTLTETAATGVLANDTDAEGAITAILVTGPTNESAFTLNADGSFTYTHDGSETTSDSFTYKANDGTADSNTVTVTITINLVNDAPVVTVPGAQSGMEDTAIVFSGTVSVADVDAGTNAVEIDLASTNGTLTLSGTTGLTFTTGDGTGDAAMTFTGTLTNINAALNGLSYMPSSEYAGGAVITVAADDQGFTGTGGALQDSETIAVTITAANDPPVNSMPGTQTFDEDTVLTLSTGNANKISISDNDAGANSVQLQLTATNGALTLSGITGLSFTVGDGTSDATMTFTGTIANINTALDGMTYTPTLNYNGSATITVNTNDQGFTGGGAQSDNDVLNLTINAVNDAPVNTVPGLQTFNEDVNRTFSTGNSNLISIADADATTAQVTLSVTNGTLSTNGIAGLSFTAGDGVDDTTMTFTGTVVNINARLDGLLFKPTANYYGSATLTILTSDQGNTGTGGTLTDTDNVSMTISPVNDPPTVTAKTHTTHSAIGLSISAASHTGELMEGATDVDDHDPVSELTVELVGTPTPANATVTVTNATDGSFYFEPTGGLSGVGSASFQFRVCDNGDVGLSLAAECSAAQTVTFNINGPDLWFVDDTDAAGCTVNCNGSRTKPYPSLASLPAGFAARGTGDRIFLFSGTYAAGAGHTFNASEHLVGQGASGSFDTHLGVSAVANGTLDTRPVLDPIPASDADLPVLQGTVTMNVASPTMRGIAIQTAGVTGFAANASGTLLTVADSIVSSNTTAVNVSGSTASVAGVNFLRTNSSGGANGIVLSNVAGSWDFSTSATPGSLTGNTVAAFSMTNSANTTPTIDYDGAIAPANNARAVDIGTGAATTGLRGGTLSFGGAFTTTSSAANGNAGGIRIRNSSAGTVTFEGSSHSISANANIGVELLTNTGATVEFTGGNLDIVTTTGKVFTATGGGTVRVAGSSNTLTTESDGAPAGGMLLEVVSTTIGTGGLNFVSATGHGASSTAKGIHLSNAGSNGVTILGTGSGFTGGTITNYVQKGAHVENTNNISFNYMNFNGNGTANLAAAGTCGDLINGTNTNCAAGIDLQDVNTATLTRVAVSGGVQNGINGRNVTALTLDNVDVTGAGNEANENGVNIHNLFGTVTWTQLDATNNAGSQLEIQNASGTNNVTLNGGTFSNSAWPGSLTSSHGILFAGYNSANMTISVQNCTIARNFGPAFNAISGLGATVNSTLNGGSLIDNGQHFVVALAESGSMTYALTNVGTAWVDGSVGGHSGVTPVSIFLGANSTGSITGTISGNTFGLAGTANSAACNGGCNAISVNNGNSDGSMTATITGNTIQRSGGGGISVTAGSGGGTDSSIMKVKITSNILQMPDNTSGLSQAIATSKGASAGDTTQTCTNILSNTINFTGGAGTWTTAATIRLRNVGTTGAMTLPGYTGAATDYAAVATYLNGRNTIGGGGTGSVQNANTFSNTTPAGSDCF
ncbi:MAG TPA: tandem-95 repeat protein, partial [Thermoanaerobaculia bacterium]|nr:tandem-95 repeat protein [Thermoanaerobaculia bacterium]